MTDLVKRLDPILVDLWISLADGGDYRAMLDSAIGGYLLFRSLPDGERLSLTLLEPLAMAAQSLAKQNGLWVVPQTENSQNSAGCSFCGKSGTSKELASGPNVKICQECVEILHKTFTG